jgi:prepilin-type N-terminal cleavage/methylation domain-containing protein
MKHFSQRSSSGFTIIELLVVIVIIGILATISVVSFNGIQQRAAGTVLMSDLKNASAQLEIAKLVNNEQYQATTSGLTVSAGTTFEYTSTGSTYCLSATSDRNGVPGYNVSSSNLSVVTGLCAGHTAPSS